MVEQYPGKAHFVDTSFADFFADFCVLFIWQGARIAMKHNFRRDRVLVRCLFLPDELDVIANFADLSFVNFTVDCCDRVDNIFVP